MKTHYLIGIMAIGLLTWNSCSKISGNGDYQTVTREVQNFKGIEVDINSDVIITKSDDYKFEMNVESNIDPYVTTQVRDSILVIKLKDNVKYSKVGNVKLNLRLPEISTIIINGTANVHVDSMITHQSECTINGSGDITIHYINTDHFLYNCNGSGEILCNNGDIKYKEIYVRGSGNVHSEQCMTEVSKFQIDGSGNIYTHTTDSMYIRINGSGNVYYKGEPKINISAVGSGSAFPL